MLHCNVEGSEGLEGCGGLGVLNFLSLSGRPWRAPGKPASLPRQIGVFTLQPVLVARRTGSGTG